MSNDDVYVHPSAVVDEGAQLGAGTRVWHFAHVMPGARVGRRCVLGQNVFVASRAVLGDGCKVQNNVALYDGVVLGDEVFCGPSMVFTNVRTPRAHVNRRAAWAETRVGRRVSFGANCTVVCGTEVGAYAFVAAGAVVTKDVPPHGLMMGVPARRTGWACACGVPLLNQPGADGATLACVECGAAYRVHAEGETHGLAPVIGSPHDDKEA